MEVLTLAQYPPLIRIANQFRREAPVPTFSSDIAYSDSPTASRA